MQGSDFLAALWDLQRSVTDLTLMHVLSFKPIAPGTEGCQHTVQNVTLINCLMTWWQSTIKLHWETGRSSWNCSLPSLYSSRNRPLLCGECPSPASQEGAGVMLLWLLLPALPWTLMSGFHSCNIIHKQLLLHSSLVLCSSGNCVCSPQAAHKTDPSAFRSITINLIFSGMSIHSEEPKRILENINHVSLSQQNP